MVPLRHGFPRRHALGNLHEAPLRALAADWRKNSGYERFRAKSEPIWGETASDPDTLPAVDWFGAGSPDESPWSAWSARVLRR